MAVLKVFLLVLALATVYASRRDLQTTASPPLRRVNKVVESPYPTTGSVDRETDKIFFPRRQSRGARNARSVQRPLAEPSVNRRPDLPYLPPLVGPFHRSNQPETEHKFSKLSEAERQTDDNFENEEDCIEGSTSRPCPEEDPLPHMAVEVMSSSLPRGVDKGSDQKSRDGRFDDIMYPDFPTSLAHETATDKIYLAWPVVKYCHERIPYTYSMKGKGYYLNSWEVPENRFLDSSTGEWSSKTFTWLEARNECRKRCMDTIGFESQDELAVYSRVLAASKLPFIWTSGRTCDFLECAGKPELKPLQLNGWSWTATGDKLAPTNAKPPTWTFQPWSPTGISNSPQPDNAEFAINGKNESCLSLMNNVYGDRITFHDVACHHKKYFTCEDSPKLIDLVFQEHGIDVGRV